MVRPFVLRFVDGDAKPTLNGAGLEDYFCGAWNFNRLDREYTFPYFGYSRKGNAHPDYTGRRSMYRFHIEDPITLDKSLRVTIEHGHTNDRSDDYSSVAYWRQAEPHKKVSAAPWGGQALADRSLDGDAYQVGVRIRTTPDMKRTTKTIPTPSP